MIGLHTKDSNKAKSIAKALNSSYYHHGYAVGRREAKEIGLNVVNPDRELEKLLWEVWKDYSSEMKCDKPFDLVSEVAQQIIIQRAQQTQVSMRSVLSIDLLVESIESSKLAKSVVNNINILYWRNADMSLGVNATIPSNGWTDNKERSDK